MYTLLTHFFAFMAGVVICGFIVTMSIKGDFD